MVIDKDINSIPICINDYYLSNDFGFLKKIHFSIYM